MSKFEWKFEEHFPDTSKHTGFIHNAIQNFAKEPIQSIVREGIQNSSDALDTQNGEKQVKVVIKTGKFLKDEVADLKNIEEHLKFCKEKDGNKAENREIQRHINLFEADQKYYSYIEIADYNTTGMNKKSFLYFTQSDFKTNKESLGSQGSKGVGKAAYFACSSLRTMLVSTKTEEGLRFRGTARLATHKNPNNPSQTLKGEGYFGNTALIDNSEIPKRFRRHEKGTSIFVIGALHTDKNFKEEVITEVLRNYWFAIAENQLVVEVEGEEINNKNLEQLIIKHFTGYRDYRTGIKQNPRPYYESYIKGQVYKRNIVNIGECKLWLHKNTSFNLGAVACFRKTKMLIYKENIIDSGFAGVFLCDDDDGNEFLKDIENEAHDEWNPNINPEKVKEARQTIKEIKEFIRESFYEFSGIDESDSFGIEVLDNVFNFSSTNEGAKTDKGPEIEKPTPEKDGDNTRDRILSKQKFSVKQKNGKYYYRLDFFSTRSVKQQKLKVSIATESSKDTVEIIGASAHEFKDDLIIMDVKKGENFIEKIELDAPYLVAPIITTIN